MVGRHAIAFQQHFIVHLTCVYHHPSTNNIVKTKNDLDEKIKKLYDQYFLCLGSIAYRGYELPDMYNIGWGLKDEEFLKTKEKMSKLKKEIDELEEYRSKLD